MENPPLWVWGIIVGAVIAGKFIYRWQATKQFAKEAEERRSKFDDKTKDISNDFYDNMKMKNTRNVRARKYSPRYFYNDYFAIRKEKK